MKYSLMFLVVGLLVCSLVFADVPRQINFQGRLTDATGKFVPDGNYSLTFGIYTDSTGGNAKWSEGQLIAVSKGLFNIVLGAVTPIPDSIFNYPNVWLGIQVGVDPEMTPRQMISSTGYAYRGARADTSSYSVNSDKLDGLHAADFFSASSDYGRSGVATDLYEGSTTLTDKYVNTAGPDSVSADSGTAFSGKVSGSSDSALYGIKGYGSNSLSGQAYGGFFSTSDSGTGEHYGMKAEGHSSSEFAAYGVYGYARSSSFGDASGGFFTTDSLGTSVHYGIQAYGYGSAGAIYGSYTYGQNYGNGGASYGSFGYAFGSANTNEAYGISGYADNTSDGGTDEWGGYFVTNYSGSGAHYGLYTGGNGSSSLSTYGSYNYASNTSTGNVYAGVFVVDNFAGTGRKYGVYAAAEPSTGYSGYFQGKVRITDSLVVLGSKSAAVKVNNGDYRLLYSQESPENWFEDFGEGQFTDGKAHIDLDPLFLQTVTIDNLHPMKVFIQLTSGSPMNVVVNKGAAGFEVVASSNSSNARFDYRVVAKRKGYENLRLAKMGGPDPEQMASQQSEIQSKIQKENAGKMKEHQRTSQIK